MKVQKGQWVSIIGRWSLLTCVIRRNGTTGLTAGSTIRPLAQIDGEKIPLANARLLPFTTTREAPNVTGAMLNRSCIAPPGES